MEFFRIHRTIPFMRHALVLNIISLVTFVAAVFFILTRGFHLSIEFTGGTVMEVNYAQTAQLESVRGVVSKLGYTDFQVQNFGTSHDVMIRLPLQEGQTSATQSETCLLYTSFIGLLYTLPNFDGESPAVQVSSAKATIKVDPAMLERVEQILTDAKIPNEGVYYEQNGTLGTVRARFTSTDLQLQARDLIDKSLNTVQGDPHYTVALNLLPASPTWMRAMGWFAPKPMYLGLGHQGTLPTAEQLEHAVPEVSGAERDTGQGDDGAFHGVGAKTFLHIITHSYIIWLD